MANGLLGANLTEEQAQAMIGPIANIDAEQASGLLGPSAGMNEADAIALLSASIPRRQAPSQAAAQPQAQGQPNDRLAELLAEKARREAAKKQQSKAELANKREKMPTTGSRVAITGLRRFVDNILSIPGVIGDGLAAAASLPQAAVDSVGNVLQGEPADFEGTRKQRFAEQREQFPASFLRDSADTGDLLAMGKGISPTDQAIADEKAKMEAPGATLAGEILGDVGTILTGRAPFVRARAPQLQANRQRVTQQFKDESPELPPHIEQELNDVVSGKIMPMLRSGGKATKRGAGKTVEASIEGATLAMLQEGDPVATGAFAAGGQAAGSLALFLGEKAIRHPIGAVATAFVASEMFKAAAPGEQDFFASKDFAIQKATAFFALGTAAALAGAGRLRSPAAEKFPVFFDAITAVPRGALISRLQEFTNESEKGNDLPVRVASAMHSKPNLFNSNQFNSLNRAMNSEKAGAFTAEVNRLLKESPSFREALEEL